MTSVSFPLNCEYSSHSSCEEVASDVGEVAYESEQARSDCLGTSQEGRFPHFRLRWCRACNSLRSMCSSDKCRRARDTSILTTALILAVLLCSLPTIVYFTIVDSYSAGGPSREVNCTGQAYLPDNSTDCSPFSWGVIYPDVSTGGCSAEPYTGSVCRQQLFAWQACAVGGAEYVFLELTSMEQSQEEKERDVAQFLHFLQSVGSEYCQRAAGLLVCQSTFPLCDCESGRSYLASREECERISIVECEEEWTSARQYGIPLPNCTDLPEEVTTGYESSGDLDRYPPLNLTNLTCREDFFESNFTCLPRCDRWEESSHAVVVALEVMVLFTAVVKLLASIVLVIIFILRYKTLIVFPTVLLMYIGIGLLVLAFFTITSVIGGRELFCGFMDVDSAVENPTTYCTIQGASTAFLLTMILLCIFFHMTVIFYKIVWPLHALKYQRYFKWIHGTLICIALSASFISVLSTLLSEDGSYTVTEFPPDGCSTRNYNFYILLLPLNILAIICICQLLVIGWIIHKKRKMAAEIKLIVILIISIVFVLFIMVEAEVRLINRPLHDEAIHNYFLCEAVGDMVGQCSRESLESYANPFLKSMSHLVFMVVPIICLVFVINCTDLKKRLGMHLSKLSDVLTSKSSLNTTSKNTQI